MQMRLKILKMALFGWGCLIVLKVRVRHFFYSPVFATLLISKTIQRRDVKGAKGVNERSISEITRSGVRHYQSLVSAKKGIFN